MAMNIRCGARYSGRDECRALLGRVERDGDGWYVEIRDDPRRAETESAPLVTPGREQLVPAAVALYAWCPRHRRQVELDADALIDAAARGLREFLVEPHPARLKFRDVERDDLHSEPWFLDEHDE